VPSIEFRNDPTVLIRDRQSSLDTQNIESVEKSPEGDLGEDGERR